MSADSFLVWTEKWLAHPSPQPLRPEVSVPLRFFVYRANASPFALDLDLRAEGLGHRPHATPPYRSHGVTPTLTLTNPDPNLTLILTL